MGISHVCVVCSRTRTRSHVHSRLHTRSYYIKKCLLFDLSYCHLHEMDDVFGIGQSLENNIEISG